MIYVQSLLSFALGANAVALPLMYVEKRKGISFHKFEYLMLYFTWGIFVGLVGFVFHGLHEAAEQLHLSRLFLFGFFVVAGVCSGLSFLPKMLFANFKPNNLVLTSVTSIIIASLFAKFSVLVFLLVPGN